MSSTADSPAEEFKVVVLGESGSGKSSLLSRICTRKFSAHMQPTLGAAFMTCSVEVTHGYSRPKMVKLGIWDTSSVAKFKSIVSMCMSNASAALLVFDIQKSSGLDLVVDLRALFLRRALPHAFTVLVCTSVTVPHRLHSQHLIRLEN
jgi:small GTP-binding protein